MAGTDTGVGKTAVAVAIVQSLMRAGHRPGLKVGVYKPVASGVRAGHGGGGDPSLLWEAAGRPLSIAAVCPQAFAAPLSPPRSARAEGRRVDDTLLRDGFAVWRNASDIVIVEGAGALFSPLGDTTLNADLVRDLGLPLVVVDAARLGAVGRTLGVIRAARAEGLTVAAAVLSHVEPCDGSHDEAAGAGAIARHSADDLASRIHPVPVTMLAHGAASFAPELDWIALSQAADQSAADTTPP